jgi:hypothetical protein
LTWRMQRITAPHATNGRGRARSGAESRRTPQLPRTSVHEATPVSPPPPRSNCQDLWVS